MNTSTSGRGLAVCLLLGAILVCPARAQDAIQDIGDNGIRPNDDIESVELTEIIDQFREKEGLSAEHPELSNVEWDAYGERLTQALASGHRGLQTGALRILIPYNEHFNLGHESVLNVMRMYRNGDTENVRRMAVVALAAMHSDYANTYIERAARFEKSDQIRYTMESIIQAWRRGVPPV